MPRKVAINEAVELAKKYCNEKAAPFINGVLSKIGQDMMKSKVFSVTQINTYIKRMFQSDYALRRISIKGQVSNCKLSFFWAYLFFIER